MSFWESLWTVFLWFLWATIFIAYLMALFSIIGDIMRDHALNGWAKAIWIVFLIFLPFLTALVYLIARGDGMSQRAAREVQKSQQAADDYIRSVAGDADPAAKIEKAHKLLESGAISQAEFEQLKAKALAA